MMISADDIKTVAEVLTLGGIGIYTALKARRADKQTVATGNGFAKFVKESLTEIKSELGKTNAKLDHHIQAHADADVSRKEGK